MSPLLRPNIESAIRVVALASLAASCFSGCATRFQGRDGTIHTVGFVWHTAVLASGQTDTPSAEHASEPRPPQVAIGPTRDEYVRLQRVRSLGVLLDFTPLQRGVGIGWIDSLLVVPDSNGLTTVQYDTSDWTGTRIATSHEKSSAH